MKVKIKKTHPNAQIPFKHYEDAFVMIVLRHRAKK
jgi:hypothetical protein|nr:MAG TPA: putative deoxyuridine 5'-triphosphate nucleotidohydrolase [Caudoviricetes sp.]